MITWNTGVDAPGCLGEIVNEDGRSILIQTDWDYPKVAQNFGWSLAEVQRCPECHVLVDPSDVMCQKCSHELRDETPDPFCWHLYTDGTVDCPDCGVGVSEFITSARDWLKSHDGVTAEDPGYFT